MYWDAIANQNMRNVVMKEMPDKIRVLVIVGSTDKNTMHQIIKMMMMDMIIES